MLGECNVQTPSWWHRPSQTKRVSSATMSHHWIFWGGERTSSFRNSELDLWRILEYSGHLIILLFKGPFKFCKKFKSLNIWRGKRGLCDLFRFSPTKQPPKKSKLLKLAQGFLFFLLRQKPAYRKIGPFYKKISFGPKLLAQKSQDSTHIQTHMLYKISHICRKNWKYACLFSKTIPFFLR